ncbi:hypothetical protein B0T18DRAFT_405957 [Schizothecium vesticola]|uniref:Uncharacterized protein n=1 Tax=Schizothecium vesticola TaxID=314040 RepID=A0AA40K7Z5_9PEZI|nr:hypothetical protein B0T18DRAFT_405957 [Schizothecium vesticola]
MLGGWVRWLAGMDEPKDNQAVTVDSDSEIDSEDDANSQINQEDSVSTNTPREDYVPTYADVVVVKCLLRVPHGYSLPTEIVDIIADHAGYWAHTTSEVKFGDDIHTMKAITQYVEDELLLRTPPLGFPHWPLETTAQLQGATILTHPPTPQPPGEPFPPEAFQTLIGSPILAHPCRKIVFTTRSRDQGWGGFRPRALVPEKPPLLFQRRGPPTLDLHDLCTQQPPVTATETIFHHELHPVEGFLVQRNQTATDEVREHRVVWSWTDAVDPGDEAGALALAEAGRGKGTGDGVFVRELRLGDVVTVWGKSRFPGWVNYVESVKVEVYWAV